MDKHSTPLPRAAAPLTGGTPLASARAGALAGRAQQTPATLPRHYVRHIDADQLARLLDGNHDVRAEPEVVRRQRDFAERRAAVTLWRQVADVVCWTGFALLLVGIAAVVLP